jgi:hypothetical protein
MYDLQIRMDWENTYCTDITIGVKTVPIFFLERYYRGLHLNDTTSFRTARYLFSLGIEAVIKQGTFKRQLDVDEVFFSAILRSCEPGFINWVQNWKDVFIQLSSSRIRFKDFIIQQGEVDLTKRQYIEMMEEVENIRGFFRLLNMAQAYRLMSIFFNSLEWKYSTIFNSLPKVYPFAAKGKPAPMLSTIRPAGFHAGSKNAA